MPGPPPEAPGLIRASGAPFLHVALPQISPYTHVVLPQE